LSGCARLSAEAPDAESALNQQARAAVLARNYAEAEALFQRLLAEYPQGKCATGAQMHLGMAYMGQEKWAQAAEAFDKAVAMSTQPANQEMRGCALHFKAACLLKLDPAAWPEAASLLNRVVTEHPNCQVVDLAQSLLGQRAVEQGKTEEALEHFQQAILSLDRRRINRGEEHRNSLLADIRKLVLAHPELAAKLVISVPDLPPRQAGAVNLLRNPGFEDAEGQAPAAWGQGGTTPAAAWGGRDRTVARSGAASAWLLATTPPDDLSWRGHFYQTLTTFPNGARVGLKGYARTCGVSQGSQVGLMVRCDSAEGRPLAFASTAEAIRLTGTQEWTPLATHILIPEQTATVWVFAFLHGWGKVWFDDIELLVTAAGKPGGESPKEKAGEPE
jgi:tetratricopeptide (TPR) repeat protein